MNRSDFVNKTFTTNSFKETKKLGQDFVKALRKGSTICLYGDLGSGKTTFVQGLAVGLGIRNRIISPTFVIARVYRIKNSKFPLRSEASKIQSYSSKFKSLEPDNFYHVDLYRIESERDFHGLGVEEIMNNKNNIVAIEWAEKMGKILPGKRIDIYFEYLDGNKRRIAIKKLSS